MKKLCTIILLSYISFIPKLNAQIVNIPDINFYNALLANGVQDSAGYITVNTANAFTGTLNVAGNGISDLTGIAAFTSINTLICYMNNISNLDLSSNHALTYLDCRWSNITSLNVFSDTSLAHLECNMNNLSNLDISSNIALTYLNCSSNHLTSLNVSSNSVLDTLYCYLNLLSYLNVSSNPALSVLSCGVNLIASLDVTFNPALTILGCESNHLISNLNLSNNIALKALGCGSNSLTSLDVSNNPGLIELDCNTNYLTSLTGLPISSLINFDCQNNNLTSLDLSTDTALVFLYCNNNKLSSLDVSSCFSLTHLYCQNNLFTSLNVKNGNNVNIGTGWFNATNNPNLTCIEVDNVAFSTANWMNAVDSGASFSTNCPFTLVNENEVSVDVNIHPNPVTTQLTIEAKSEKIVNIKLYNVLGDLVYNHNFTGNSLNVDMSREPKGIYFLKITDYDKNIVNKKIIKK